MTANIISPQALADMVAWRRHIHAHPELSGQEYETRAFILQQLQQLGIAAQTFTDHAGIIGTIHGNAPGKTIALRADMDALPITEENTVDYRSQTPGVMHACGHDSHVAILLGTAASLQRSRQQWSGTVKLLFQPAEEDAPAGGAPKMIASGALANVDAIFGLHVWPELPYGKISINRGPMMASSDRLTLTLNGSSAHAGMPQHGIDAVMMAADVLTALSRIVHRRLDPREIATIAIGTIHGGERYNVVAQQVELAGTVRCLSEAVRQQIPEQIKQMVTGICQGYGGSYELNYQWGYPSLCNSVEEASMVILTASRLLPPECVLTDLKPALGAEDFAFYLQKVPGAFFFLGCGAEGEAIRPLHNSRFNLDERAMYLGSQILEETALTALAITPRKEAHANIHIPLHY